MTALDYFYKLGEVAALSEIVTPVAGRMLHIDPSILSSVYSEDPQIVRDRTLYFAKNFLRSRAALEEKLLRMALRKGLSGIKSTTAESVEDLAGHAAR